MGGNGAQTGGGDWAVGSGLGGTVSGGMGGAGSSDRARGNGCPSRCSARDFGGARGSGLSGTDVIGRCGARVGIGDGAGDATAGTGGCSWDIAAEAELGALGSSGRAGLWHGTAGSGSRAEANGQMTGASGSIVRAWGMADGSDGIGGIGRAEGMGSGSDLAAEDSSTRSGGTGSVGSGGAQVGIGAGQADGSGLLGATGRGTGSTESSSTGLAQTWHGSGVGCKGRGCMTGATGGIGWAEGISGTMRAADDGGIEAGTGPGAWAASRTGYISCIVALKSSQVAGPSSVSRTAAKVLQEASSV